MKHEHLPVTCIMWCQERDLNPHDITIKGFSYYSMLPWPLNKSVVVWTISSPYLFQT